MENMYVMNMRRHLMNIYLQFLNCVLCGNKMVLNVSTQMPPSSATQQNNLQMCSE